MIFISLFLRVLVCTRYSLVYMFVPGVVGAPHQKGQFMLAQNELPREMQRLELQFEHRRWLRHTCGIQLGFDKLTDWVRLTGILLIPPHFRPRNENN